MNGLPPRAAHVQRIDWEAVAQKIKEAAPGEAVLIFEGASRLKSLHTNVNQGNPRALRDLGGTVTGHMRNSRIDGAGDRVGDLWVVWDPDADPAGRYKAKYTNKDR